MEFRSGDGKGIAEFTIEEAKSVKEKLDQNGIRISALGSPIGKIGILDDFEPHFEVFQHVCELAKLWEPTVFGCSAFIFLKRASLLNTGRKCCAE